MYPRRDGGRRTGVLRNVWGRCNDANVPRGVYLGTLGYGRVRGGRRMHARRGRKVSSRVLWDVRNRKQNSGLLEQLRMGAVGADPVHRIRGACL